MSETKRRKELEEEGEYVEINELSDITIDSISLVNKGAIGRSFFLLKSDQGGDTNMHEETSSITKDIGILATQLNPCPSDLQQAVGYISKTEAHYGEVHSTDWSTAKIILTAMLELVNRLKTDDAPKPLLTNLLIGYLERGEKGFWTPTKPPRGVPQFSKSKAKTQKSSQNKEELSAVETIENLAKSMLNKSDANDKRTFHEICGDLWENHPNLLRLALMQHHQKVTKSHEGRKLAKSNGTGLTGLEKCDALAREMVLHDSKLTIEEARSRTFSLYPQIYEQCQKEFEDGLPLPMGT